MDWGQESSSSNGPTKVDNIFVETAQIQDVNITYGEKASWQNFADDIGVEMTLDIGKGFNPKMYIGGNFKVDTTSGEVVGWSTAFKVKLLFDALDMPIKLSKGKQKTDQRLPSNAPELMKGKKFARLSYKSSKIRNDGKNRWIDWQQVDKASVNHQEFKNKFRDAVAKGFVKNFVAPEDDAPWVEPSTTSTEGTKTGENFAELPL